ncbi:hypothetical protein LOTGIDRAFT_165642 [Lottia gigantea]|uniref:Sodium/calcium exchanger membrane region domain-containing protein n=1 Tax=Lottia gigantea TaxID=225164 RepID=V4A5G9_LOTGI|nr:hypothetical protein LOTGIDRAFT_165642 [Lottia gigantea]ESO88501.1 hypothetical protein LOTGIDRAFT_165642 [Lottia gigantea]
MADIDKESWSSSKDETSITVENGQVRTPDVCDLPKVRLRTSNTESNDITLDITSSIGPFERSAQFIAKPENVIEAHRISNNYLFGFKKWKSHVTARPLSSRSEIVQDLYSDDYKIKNVSTIRISNILYTVFIGWWLALLYLLVAGLMLITIVGRPYAYLCWNLSKYFLWPFGKFLHQIHPIPLHIVAQVSFQENDNKDLNERSTLLGVNDIKTSEKPHNIEQSQYWRRPLTYLWFLLGIPFLVIGHSIACFLTWMFVVSIPMAKVNLKAMRIILFLPPEQVTVHTEAIVDLDSERLHSEILLYTHQSMNIYYYKFTIDGVNVILKCILAILAIIPLTYYIGLSITSISAQSSFAVGAILNATFGSIVEIILFVIVLKKGVDTDKGCYQELVKSSLAGTILASILFIPGVCMIVGGIKFRTQNFNPRSASVSAALLFVSIVGIFAPTIFSKIYGDLTCNRCEYVNQTDINGTSNATVGFKCDDCKQSLFGLDGDKSLYEKHIEPLIYACAIVLPISYIVGLIFTLKTHSSHIYDAFNEQLKATSTALEESAQWSRLKSTIILLFCAVLIALCADLVTNNLQPLLESTGVSEYFVGVTMLALVPELPEVVNGVQFSLQNNVNLG